MGEYLEDHPNDNGAIHRLEDSWYGNQQIHLENIFLMERTYFCILTNNYILKIFVLKATNHLKNTF